MDDILVKEEPMPQVKVETQPISVPIPLPFFGKEEPNEDTASTSVDIKEKRKARRNSEDMSNKKIRFECEECDYSASTKYNLSRHMMKHTGKKPFKCDECDYSSSQKSNLNTHKMIHTGEKPFKCDECDYSSSWKSHLNTQDDPYWGKAIQVR